MRMLTGFFIPALLGFFTVASAQLPPEIRADAYLLQAEQAIRNGDSFRAQAAIQNILHLQTEHELDLSGEFHFRYAKAADAVDLSDQALESVLKYLVASGREGQHYVEALTLMNKVQDRSSRDVAAAQLSPNIIADAYMLQAEQSIRDGDHNQARGAIQNIRNLQDQHELDLPNEFHFRYAKAADVLDMPDQALESILKYLAVSGREGQHYVEALALMNKMQMAVSCKGWDTEEYFKTATLEEVTACLDTGVDLNARDDAGATPLHRAAKNTENLDVIEALINAGADKEARDNGKRTPLHVAAESSENPDVIKFLLDAGAEEDVWNQDYRTPLHLAARYNENPDVIKVLIDAGADLEVQDKDSFTPLHLAAEVNKNPDIVKVLIDAGANLEAQDKDYRTPLYRAVSFNNLSAINILINAGANKARVKDKWTPLHWAAAYNESLDHVKSLINTGADLKAKDKDKRTPLHVAAAHNENPDILKVLINAGADLKAKDKDKRTPLHLAAKYNQNSDILKILIDAGANPHEQGSGKWTPLHDAAESNENPDILKVLIDTGADPKARTGGFLAPKWTPLHIAAMHNENPDIFKVLIGAGADPNARDRGWTPLDLTAYYNQNPDILKVLIDAGADPNAKDNDNWTPLHWAAKNNQNPAIVQVLIDVGADIEARTEFKSTPLHLAAEYNENPDILKVLIDAGADLNVQDTNNNTPLHHAADKKNPARIKILVDAGANVNAQGFGGDLPLDEVMRWGSSEEKTVVVKLLRDAGARGKKELEKESDSGFGKTAAALLGGAAIMYAGKDAEDQEAVTEAVREYMEGVLSEQPDGNINSATPPSQTQGGQAQDPMQQALQNLENVCGEKYQGNFADNDHYRFYCMAAFNDYCALKRAQSSEAINKLRASLQQNCAVLKSVGADSKCSYCK